MQWVIWCASHYTYNNLYTACRDKDYDTIIKCFKSDPYICMTHMLAQLIIYDNNIIELSYAHCNGECDDYHPLNFKLKIDACDSTIMQLVLSIHKQIKDNCVQLAIINEQLQDLVMFKDFHQLSTF